MQELRMQEDGKYTLWVEQLDSQHQPVKFTKEDLALQQAALKRDLAMLNGLLLLSDEETKQVAMIVDSVKGTGRTFGMALSAKIKDIENGIATIELTIAGR